MTAKQPNPQRVRFYDIEWDTDADTTPWPAEATLTVDAYADVSMEGAEILTKAFGVGVVSYCFEFITPCGVIAVTLRDDSGKCRTLSPEGLTLQEDEGYGAEGTVESCRLTLSDGAITADGSGWRFILGNLGLVGVDAALARGMDKEAIQDFFDDAFTLSRGEAHALGVWDALVARRVTERALGKFYAALAGVLPADYEPDSNLLEAFETAAFDLVVRGLKG